MWICGWVGIKISKNVGIARSAHTLIGAQPMSAAFSLRTRIPDFRGLPCVSALVLFGSGAKCTLWCWIVVPKNRHPLPSIVRQVRWNETKLATHTPKPPYHPPPTSRWDFNKCFVLCCSFVVVVVVARDSNFPGPGRPFTLCPPKHTKGISSTSAFRCNTHQIRISGHRERFTQNTSSQPYRHFIEWKFHKVQSCDCVLLPLKNLL